MCEYRNRNGSSKSKKRVRIDHPGDAAAKPRRGDFRRAAIPRSCDIPVGDAARRRSLQICLIAIAAVSPAARLYSTRKLVNTSGGIRTR